MGQEPKVGDLVQFNKDGFDDMPYIDEGIGFIERIKDNKVKVYVFNKTRYIRKNWYVIQFNSTEDEYSKEDFLKLFFVINHAT